MVHWANVNTTRRIYKIECLKLDRMMEGKQNKSLEIYLKNIYWLLKDMNTDIKKAIGKCVYKLKVYVYKMTQK